MEISAGVSASSPVANGIIYVLTASSPSTRPILLIDITLALAGEIIIVVNVILVRRRAQKQAEKEARLRRFLLGFS